MYTNEHLDKFLPSQPLVPDEVMLIDVLLLCAECQRPIKARINTPQWIRVEWIGPSGECQACYNEKKAKRVSPEAQLVRDEF